MSFFTVVAAFLLCALSLASGRKPDDSNENAKGFFIGFAIGCVLVLIAVLVWIRFEGCDACRGKKSWQTHDANTTVTPDTHK